MDYRQVFMDAIPRLDPRVSQLASWKEVRERAPNLLQHPVDTRNPSFKQWVYTNGFKEHDAFDFHVYEDCNDALVRVGRMTRFSQILPGILIYRPFNENPYHNAAFILHSFPKNGTHALMSMYWHWRGTNQQVALGKSLGQMGPALWHGNNALSRSEGEILQHLHLEMAEVPMKDIRELISSGTSLCGSTFEEAFHYISRSENSGTGIWQGHSKYVDPLDYFPLGGPMKYAFFDHGLLKRACAFQKSSWK
jgi:hypothetical protein